MHRLRACYSHRLDDHCVVLRSSHNPNGLSNSGVLAWLLLALVENGGRLSLVSRASSTLCPMWVGTTARIFCPSALTSYTASLISCTALNRENNYTQQPLTGKSTQTSAPGFFANVQLDLLIVK